MDNKYSNKIQPDKAANRGVRPLSTVLKTLDLLALFAASRRPLRLSEVTAATGLSRATAYQRLLTLLEAGMLEQDDGGSYRLSMYSVRLAAAALDQADIGARAEPVLHRLCETLGETVSLAILDRGRPCIVARVESDSLLRAVQEIGTMLDLEGSASGRVLTAFADAATLQRLQDGTVPLAPPDVLAQVRADGWAVSSGYTHSGVVGFAAPVADPRGGCAAALSLVQPDQRFDLDHVRGPVLAAAAEISAMLRGSQETPT
ncbi:IclR family transcriptional regulator [Mesobaculum littorinae]|uniref:IclR family transcriptional regulator n=1 Tax=Mesobaculum littorinae TaxID=2486419 RepID=A0A438AKJ0_9RHOB|nr:IclR family transcriptional regulator [Mesobaculum littorinae]RVV99228.1 IclR family transcriptional regulator [Mesobaculum littorinae]